jgi:hypothetical protein
VVNAGGLVNRTDGKQQLVRIWVDYLTFNR